MAEGEPNKAEEQMAKALRADAELLRKNVPEIFRASADAELSNAFLPAANADSFSEDISEVHDRAADFERKTFFQQQAERAHDEMGIASKTGAMTLGSIGVDRGEKSTSDKRRKEEARLNRLLTLLDDLRGIDQQIAENNEALDAISHIRELRARGEFDPENEEHRRLLDTAGISVGEYERDGETALDRRERELNEQNERLEQQRLATREALQTEHGLADREIDEKLDANFAIRTDQRDIQDEHGVHGITIDDRRVTEHIGNERTAFSNTEDEVAQFVREFANAQRAEDDAERLALEKVLVEGLSEDAQLLALRDDTVAHVFEDGYFDALEAPEEQVARVAPTSNGPSV
jgi:hypothetical protein